jgi:peptidoglycan/LPS O-acetylase OafA/YrhL
MNSWLLGFVLGMLLADMYVNRYMLFRRLNNKYTYILLSLAIFFGGYPSGDVSNPFYKILYIPFLDRFQQVSFYISIGAFLCVISVLAVDRIKNFLAHPFVSNLGKYTYSLYLVHMPILFSVCISIFLSIRPIGFHKASLLSIVLTLAVIVIATYLFERFIDKPSVKIANYCAKLYFGEKKLDLKQEYTRRIELPLWVKLSLFQHEVTKNSVGIEKE